MTAQQVPVPQVLEGMLKSRLLSGFIGPLNGPARPLISETSLIGRLGFHQI